MRPNIDSLIVADKQSFKDIKPRVIIASVPSQNEWVVYSSLLIDVILLSPDPTFLFHLLLIIIINIAFT
jgi:hypothetical protein